MIGKYPNEAAVVRRVEKLKTFGICTGYRVYEDGSASPLYDPDIEAEEVRHDRKAAEAED
jgi:hypothetical protein